METRDILNFYEYSEYIHSFFIVFELKLLQQKKTLGEYENRKRDMIYNNWYGISLIFSEHRLHFDNYRGSSPKFLYKDAPLKIRKSFLLEMTFLNLD